MFDFKYLYFVNKCDLKIKTRYYLRFKDNYRQLALDVLQGVKINEEENTNSNLITKTSNTINNLFSSTSNTLTDETNQAEREENVRQLVDDLKKLLIDDNEDCYGKWALINYTEYSNSIFKILF